MKSQTILSNRSIQSLVIFFCLILLASGSWILDREHHFSRNAHELYLKQLAAEFLKNSQVKTGSKPPLDLPGLASFHEYLMTMDPVEHRVPSERLLDAFDQVRRLQMKSTSYQLDWSGTSTEMGGRTRAIMWDPNDPSGNKVWAAGVTGGLWYNPNISSNLASWHPVSDLWPNLVISSIVYDPNNPLIFYVGTGEAQTALITYRESSGRGVGIWKTTDGGQSFTLLPSTSGFAYVTKIAVRNESGSSVVYAAVVSGVYKGLPWQSQPTDGLYRSTNGGESWNQVLPHITGTSSPYAPSDVQLGSDGRIYVGTMPNLDGNGGATILYSDLGTTGSWTEFTDIRTLIEGDPVYNKPYRTVIATAPSNANVVYAAISAGVVSSTTNPVYKGYYMLKSSDKGANWEEINTPDGSGDWANLAWHAMDLAVDPNDAATVYAGGLDIWKTTNSGNYWLHLSDWSLMYYGGGDQYIHADQHVISYKPGSSSTILFGTDGGIFYTVTGNNPSPVFIQKNKNFNTLQFYTCAMHPAAGEDQFLGGLQDNGTLLYKGTPHTINDMICGGDGAYCFWDQDQSNIYLTSYYYNRYYVFNNGMQVNTIDHQSGTFVNPADYNNSQNTLYANAVDYWGDKANKILRVANIPQNGYGSFVNVGTSTNSYFSAVRVSPYSTSTNTRLFLGTSSGRLFRVDKAQSEPETVEIGSTEFPASNISCIAVGGSDDTLLVTFSNYGVSSIWQTCNAGSDWREVEGNLPDMPVRWAVYHPQNTNQALIATELGVWSSNNLQGEYVLWQPQSTGMANVRVDMLSLRNSDNTVLAATHGRGLYTTNFTLDLNTSVPEMSISNEQLKSYCKDHELHLFMPTRVKSPLRLRVTSMLGKTIVDTRVNPVGNEIIQALPITSQGVYLIEISGADKKFTGSTILY